MTKRGGMGGRAHGYITKLERKMKEDKARKGRGKKEGGDDNQRVFQLSSFAHARAYP